MKTKFVLIALLFFAFAFNAQAQSTPGVKERQKKQQKRIKKGVKSGELTKGEFVKLQTQQAAVQKKKKNAKSDGVVTKKERASIHRSQNKTSKNIYKKKHNDNNRN